MKIMGKNLAAMVIVGTLVCGCLPLASAKGAGAATTKQAITLTLDKKHWFKNVSVYTNVAKLGNTDKWKQNDWSRASKKYGVQTKIEILKMKGKPKAKMLSTLWVASCMYGEGCLVFELPAKKIKKGVVLDQQYGKNAGNDDINIGDTTIQMRLDDIEGVSKVTYRVTFTNPSNRKIFKNVKVQNVK